MNLDQESNNGLSNVQLAQERVYDRFEAQWQQNSSYQLENLIPQIDDLVTVCVETPPDIFPASPEIPCWKFQIALSCSISGVRRSLR